MGQRTGDPEGKGKAAEKESAAEYCLANPKALCAACIAASLVNRQYKQCGIPGCQEPCRDCNRETNH